MFSYPDFVLFFPVSLFLQLGHQLHASLGQSHLRDQRQ